MKYVKPLQLFMEMRKPKAEYLVIGLVNTPRHVCMSIVSSGNTSARPLDYHTDKTKYAVEQLSYYQDQREGPKLLGIVVGKNHVDEPMELVDDLCRTGKFKSLKYTYWVDNIVSVGAPVYMLLDDLCKPMTERIMQAYWVNILFPRRSKSELNLDLEPDRLFLGNSPRYAKGLSSHRMLSGYMDFCNTFVARRNEDFISIPSDEEKSAD